MTDLDELPQPTVAGRCYCCRAWTAAGHPVAEDVGASGAGGATVVRCAGCTGPHPRHRRPDEPRRYQL